MASTTVIRQLLAESRRVGATATPVLDRLREDPANFLALAGMTPDPWQARCLRSTSARMLLCCSRQSGKSTVGAALALKAALLEPGLVLVVSKAERQAVEMFRKVTELYAALGRPVARANTMTSELHLVNGSRIIPLPGKEETIRSFSSVRLLLLDEASRVPDALYYSTRPMLSVSQGKLVALSTPAGKRGWFHASWEGPEPWERVRIRADQCPRITPEFLAEEAKALGPRWMQQEYFCSFEDLAGSLFPSELIEAAFDDSITPLFPVRP